MSNMYMNNAYIYESRIRIQNHIQTYFTTHIYQYDTSLFFCYDNYPLKYNCHDLYRHEPQPLLKYLYEKS